MSANPFDNEEGIFFALKNAAGQYSLWPNSIEVPKGWQKEFGPAMRAECLNFIETNWTDMRPNYPKS